MTTPRVAKRARSRIKPREDVGQLTYVDQPPSENGGPTPEEKPPRPSLRERASENSRLLIALALLIAGVVLVLLGWQGAANTNILSEQIPYLISGGLLGLGLIIVAGIMAASAANLREAELLRRDIKTALASARTGAMTSQTAGRVFIVPGGTAYHVPGCPVAEGKDDLKSMSEREAIEADYATCRLCGPE